MQSINGNEKMDDFLLPFVINTLYWQTIFSSRDGLELVSRKQVDFCCDDI